MSHLSKISEEIILWVTDEFSFAKLTDKCATGSSLMPQKKNPDVPELIRGKTGRVYGHLQALLTMVKGYLLLIIRISKKIKSLYLTPRRQSLPVLKL